MSYLCEINSRKKGDIKVEKKVNKRVRMECMLCKVPLKITEVPLCKECKEKIKKSLD